MLKEALQYLSEMALSQAPKVIEVDGRKYRSGQIAPISDPEVAEIRVHTLQAIADWAAVGEHDGNLLVVVKDHEQVSVVSGLFGQWHQRHHYMESTLQRYEGFPFGRYLEIEQFVIELQSKFDHSAAKAQLIKAVGSIRSGEVRTVEDDGISQTATFKSEGGRLAEAEINPIISLAPFRTFREVPQPESDFLFRLRKSENGLPQAALFEADGGTWKLRAIDEVRDWLKASLPATVTVIA
jgi:hypothetical protein